VTINLNRANLSAEPLNATVNAAIEQASLAKHAGDQPRGSGRIDTMRPLR